MSQLQKSLDDPFLQKHLTNSHALQILAAPFVPFEAPTPQTKASFETRTSAINVSPSPQGPYDIKQIQEDTRWLSKETNIDEVSALRVAVLEWQSRPASELLEGNSLETTASFRSALGGNSLQLSRTGLRSTFSPGTTTLTDGELNLQNNAKSRRLRLLEIYLAERQYIIKTSTHIVFAALCQLASGDGKGKSTESMTWIEKLGTSILSVWNIQELSQNTRKNFFVSAVEALQSRLSGLEKGSGWFKEEDFQEDLELAWTKNQILEMMHILQLMLTLLDSMADLTRSDAFLAWFRLMGTFGFFETFEPVSFQPVALLENGSTDSTAVPRVPADLFFALTIACWSRFVGYAPSSCGT